MTTTRWALKYLPDSHYGDLYPRWIIGVWNTRAAAEAVRMQCANTSQIEVVEYVAPEVGS